MHFALDRKGLLQIAGALLFAASLLFIVAYTARNWDSVTSVRVVDSWWLMVAGLLYAVSHISTGLSWPLALRQLDEPVPLLTGIRIGLISQSGKYLPGNFAHYVARGSLASSAGITLRSSSVSVAVELVSALAAGMLIAALMLSIDFAPLAFLPAFGAGEMVIVLLIVAGSSAVVAWLLSKGYGFTLFAVPAVCLSASFILSGLSLHALSMSLGYTGLTAAAAIGSFALAWVAGFVLPGAPAGLGVREAILLALLGPIIGPGPTLACVLLHRVVTALIDGLAAVIGYLWLASASRAKK